MRRLLCDCVLHYSPNPGNVRGGGPGYILAGLHSGCMVFPLFPPTTTLCQVELGKVVQVLRALLTRGTVGLRRNIAQPPPPLVTSLPALTSLPAFPRVFPTAHTDNVLHPCAPYVSDETITPSSSVQPIIFGTTPPLPSASESTGSYCFAAPKNLSVSIGSEEKVVQPALTTKDISAPAAYHHPMEPSTALALRRLQPVCPYNADVWELLLQKHGLLSRYYKIPAGFRFGFDLHLPLLTISQIPPNHPSLLQHRVAFNRIIERELETGHYIGPFRHSQLLELLGAFQTSPVSIIPKSGKPGKFRVIQNFSFPYLCSPSNPSPSINSCVDSDDFACTWGTFDTVCSIIRHLPPGSQAATRDVAEAYRTIPLLPSQWPATVIRIDEDAFCVDTCTSFGMGPSAGAYGYVADAGADLMRAAGLGPLTKWVDDHLFFRIERQYLASYNSYCQALHTSLSPSTFHQTGGRLWFEGSYFEDGTLEVFGEDCRFPISDFSNVLSRSSGDARFTCDFSDIDRNSVDLGIPWEPAKDTPFAHITIFIGLLWNLLRLTVALADAKKSKYLAAIATWLGQPTHVLLEVQCLYGKLLHACLVVPHGRAYLTSMETMLSISSASPFVPHHSVRHLVDDLSWWATQLSSPSLHRPIPQPFHIIDAHAYSDTSSGVGVAVVIHGYWRAWTLLPGWHTLDGAKDIGWAEAVGFELLVRCIIRLGVDPAGQHFRVHCDNLGVVEGWKNGRSRNWATNIVFRRILALLEPLSPGTSFHLSYIPSGDNPADAPSRGKFPSVNLLLPPIELPPALSGFIQDGLPCHVESRNPFSNTRQQRDSATHPLVDGSTTWDYGAELWKFRDAWRD